MTGTQHCTIVPGYLLRRLARTEPDLAPAVTFTLRDGEATRHRREIAATRWPQGHPPRPGDGTDPGERPWPGGPTVSGITLPPRLRDQPGQRDVDDLEGGVVEEARAAVPDRRVHDCDHGTTLPGGLVRAEGDEPSSDPSVNEAFAGLGATWEVLHRRYGRDSLDGSGMPLVASVHYARDYDNAFWDGQQMVFGDGDGVYFQRFTGSVDVIAHELAHGVTQYTAGLTYVGQPGALNESASDVWGAIVRQWVRGQTVEEADWLIGAELFTDRVQGVALRSMAAPGTAYDDPRLGRDPQPAHMDDHVRLPHDADNDNGGVHINSGIPNKAFHLFATALGEHVWEVAGQVWFDTMTTRGLIPRDVDFAGFAGATVRMAQDRYGEGSEVDRALRSAWSGVGIEL